MAAPEGYTELGRIGFVDKGNYASGTTYRTGDVVYYNGSTWVALKDNLRGVTPAPGANWKYMARGFAAEALSAITAVDTSGVLREAGASVTSQELIDAIADKVMTKLIEKSKIVNNLLATDATTVLSGPMGKSLDDKITQLNSDLDKRLNAITITSGTLLDAIKNMGDNVHNLFVAAPYFPPDIPLQAAEFAIEIIKENDTSRIMVIAHRYGGELSSFYRTLFNGQWNSGWVQK